MQKEGILIVVSGFSGVGKGTLMKELLNRYPEDYSLSISATSRNPREGEMDGREYFFKTREEFETMLKEDAFLEHAEYNGNYYGTPKSYVLSELKKGKNVILEIEVQGGVQVHNIYPETFLMYVLPPSAKENFERLVNRQTETMDVIMKRMNRAIDECAFIPQYDFVVINDDFERCLNEIHGKIMEKQNEMNFRHEIVGRLMNELKDISKGE